MGGNSPKCPTTCDSSAKAPHANFSSDKWAFTGDIETYTGEAAIQKAVMAHGPIEVAFNVYKDFEDYSGGVYSYDGTSPQMGGHAVKLVGWGVDAGVKYWKIANSWNPYWGENGHFRIKRGSDECGIESQTAANDGTGEWRQGTPPPAPPPKPGDCAKKLTKDCGPDKGKPSCLQCVISHIADLKEAGCNSKQIMGFCGT